MPDDAVQQVLREAHLDMVGLDAFALDLGHLLSAAVEEPEDALARIENRMDSLDRILAELIEILKHAADQF